MGWPVGHSLSPRLHGYWLRHHAIDGAYVPLAVVPEGLATALRALPALGFRGVNLTLPHKEQAVSIVDRTTLTARRIGAVNTVVVEEGGQLLGDNTDGFGFLASLSAGRPGWRADAGPAVLLGAGGAARAIAVSLLDQAVPELRILNRSRNRAETLAAELGGRIRVEDWDARHAALAGAALLVNTTSLGMIGQPPLEIGLEAMPRDGVVVDAVYAPLETALLAAARARGQPAVDGLGMLLHQARPGFRAWFGQEPEVTEELRRVVLDGARGR